MAGEQVNLTGGRRLARNILWNLIGNGAPLLVALVAIPLLIKGLGTERFGLLTLAWMVVGYFSLFDLGLGRALTKLVAERLGQGLDLDVHGLIWTAMVLMGALGVLGAICLTALSPWLVGTVLKIPAELQSETLTSFYLLAVSIPVVVSSIGLRGVLEAHQRFGLVNSVRVPLGIMTFLGPVAVLPFSKSLVAVVSVLVVARTISWVVYAFACVRVEPALGRSIGLQRAEFRPLLSFGGWMTVSNIVGPMMVYLDRFLIGAMVSMAAVAYYATPYDVVTKLWIIPSALMGVMFPAFAATLVQDRERAAHLFTRVVSYIFLSLYPAVLIIVTFAEDGLTIWLGTEFADNSASVLQLLTLGVLINSLSKVPFGLIQSAGRADWTAKLHLLELPLYLLLLWWLLGAHGIIGAAVAWVVRVAIDTFFLFVMAHRILPAVSPFAKRLLLVTGAAMLLASIGALIPAASLKGLYLLVALAAFIWAAWQVVLTGVERSFIRERLRTAAAFISG